jgi:hypothetical protein
MPVVWAGGVVNVGELLRERERLQGVIDEAKTARFKLKQVNVLIALYGDGEAPGENGAAPAALVTCAKCGAEYKGVRGLSMHNTKTHGGKPKAAE